MCKKLFIIVLSLVLSQTALWAGNRPMEDFELQKIVGGCPGSCVIHFSSFCYDNPLLGPASQYPGGPGQDCILRSVESCSDWDARCNCILNENLQVGDSCDLPRPEEEFCRIVSTTICAYFSCQMCYVSGGDECRCGLVTYYYNGQNDVADPTSTDCTF